VVPVNLLRQSGVVGMLRGLAFLTGLLAVLPAFAGEMSADEAQRFVIGNLFNYTCFEGTRGQGRVMPDGSVVGSIQLQGAGQVRYAALPAGTLRVKGQSVCASVHDLPVQPCFNLERTNDSSFRGSVSGLSFAYCDFRKQNPRTTLVHSMQSGNQPLGLRPSLSATNN
jgi:hypothetical protein